MLEHALTLIASRAPGFKKALDARVAKGAASPELIHGIIHLLEPMGEDSGADMDPARWRALRALFLSGPANETDLRSLPRPQGASHLLRHIKSGDLYVISNGDLGRKVSLGGTRHYDLDPAFTLLDPIDGAPLPDSIPSGRFKTLNKTHAHTLVVTQRELDEQFEPESRWYARQNTPIEKLMESYEREHCDFSDILWCAQSAERIVENIPDSQMRCFLKALSGFALSSFGMERTPTFDPAAEDQAQEQEESDSARETDPGRAP